METVYIGLGSNLGDSQGQLTSALEAMDQLGSTRVQAVSSMYASKPMGPQDQPDYVNAVAQLETQLSPAALLRSLQKIEQDHHRQRKDERWGPRTLDLDILLFGDQKIDTPDLVIPHYGMAEREFVLVPLFELSPSMIMPDGKPIAKWVARCSLDGLRRLRSSNLS